MNIKIWAKTVLTVQKYLERICDSIDACVDKKAIASAFVNSKNCFQNDSCSVANWMLEMSERKVSLINLNVICLTALKNIDRTYAKILALKYFDRMSSINIANLLDLSERTYFRKLNEAHDNFESWLYRNGYNAEYFSEKYKNEGWITEVYYDTERLMNNVGTKNNVITLNPRKLVEICSAIK